VKGAVAAGGGRPTSRAADIPRSWMVDQAVGGEQSADHLSAAGRAGHTEHGGPAGIAVEGSDALTYSPQGEHEVEGCPRCAPTAQA
jgi:hypothetical protein